MKVEKKLYLCDNFGEVKSTFWSVTLTARDIALTKDTE